MDLSKEKLVIDAALGEIASLYASFGQNAAVHDKGSNDLVTDLDFAVEKLLIERLTDAFPHDNVVSEEFNSNKPLKSRNWIIDPLDGTVNYALGSELYGTQISLSFENQPALSFIYLPKLNKTCFAEKGKGAFINGKRVFVDKNADPKKTILCLGDFSKEHEALAEYQTRLFVALRKRFMRVRVFGASVYDFLTVADGNCSCHLMHARHLWDVFPGLLFSTEAGAIASRADGSPYEPYFPSLAVCASSAVQNAVIEATREVGGLADKTMFE